MIIMLIFSKSIFETYFIDIYFIDRLLWSKTRRTGFRRSAGRTAAESEIAREQRRRWRETGQPRSIRQKMTEEGSLLLIIVDCLILLIVLLIVWSWSLVVSHYFYSAQFKYKRNTRCDVNARGVKKLRDNNLLYYCKSFKGNQHNIIRVIYFCCFCCVTKY